MAENNFIEVLGFPLLIIMAMGFVLLPLIFKSRSQQEKDVAIQSELNEALFAENIQSLDEQLSNGEITEKTYARLKLELETQLEQDQKLETSANSGLPSTTVKWVLVASAIILPALAFIFYQQWGGLPDLAIYEANIQKIRQQERGASAEELEKLNSELKALLEKRLSQRTENLHNRFLLARTYAELEEYENSLDAYQVILTERPQSPDVVGEMAQVLYLREGGKFTPEVKAMYDRAIAMSPQNVRTISFAGLSAYQGGDLQSALQYWQQAVSLSEPGTQQFDAMNQALNETRRQLKSAGIEVSEAESTKDGPQYTVEVALGEGVDLNPSYKVFIYAKAWQGPPMPLAIQQATVADLPLTVTLDESMGVAGMAGAMKLSNFPQLELVARVSLSGSAMSQTGDWEASLGPINQASPEEMYELVIASQIQ